MEGYYQKFRSVELPAGRVLGQFPFSRGLTAHRKEVPGSCGVWCGKVTKECSAGVFSTDQWVWAKFIIRYIEIQHHRIIKI